MSIVDSSCSKTLSFQPPTNLNAIRSTLLKRIHLKKQENTLAPPTSLTTSPRSNPSTSSFSSPLLSPATKTASLLDHGLPSPPVEYQKKQQVDTMDIDMDTHQDEVDDDDEDDAVSTISSLPPTNNTASASLAALDASSSSLSSTTTPLSSESWNAQQLELKIRQLKEEKHQLFTQMKNLLQQQEKPAIVQSTRPSALKTNCALPDHQKETDEKLTQQEPSLPSPSPSPTSTPKTMNLQTKQKTFLKSTSSTSPRSSSYHNNNHPHAFHYQQQQYRRRRSSLTSNNCLSAAAVMMTTSRYYPNSSTLSFGTASTNNNNNNNSSNSMISPNSSSMTMDNNGRYRYSPYGVYFTPISSSPSGYNVRRPSYLPSRSTSSLASTTTIPVSSSPSPNTFRPSRPLVNRHNPRY